MENFENAKIGGLLKQPVLILSVFHYVIYWSNDVNICHYTVTRLHMVFVWLRKLRQQDKGLCKGHSWRQNEE